MAEQRRLRRQLEASLARTTPHRRGDHGGHHRLPACANCSGPTTPACGCCPCAPRRGPATGAARPSYPRRWRNIIRWSAIPPPLRAEEWTRACLEPALGIVNGAVPAVEPRRSTRPRKAIPISTCVLTLHDASPCAAGPATVLAPAPGTLRHRPKLRPPPGRISTVNCWRTARPFWRISLENNLLSAQSAERASYLTNMLNSLDVAVMVIEQPPAPVPAVVSLVNRSFCELFRMEHAQVEGGSATCKFMELVRPILPDWETQLGHHRGTPCRPHRRAHRRDHARLQGPRRRADAPAPLRHARARRPGATFLGGCSFSATSLTTRRSNGNSSTRRRWIASARWPAAWRTISTIC